MVIPIEKEGSACWWGTVVSLLAGRRLVGNCGVPGSLASLARWWGTAESLDRGSSRFGEGSACWWGTWSPWSAGLQLVGNLDSLERWLFTSVGGELGFPGSRTIAHS